MIVCGDFFQLPPIISRSNFSTKRFAREAECRDKLNFAVCYLTEQHRQANDQFLTLLNELRTGNPSEQSIDLLKSRLHKPPQGDIPPVKLYTHNTDVDRINHQKLASLDEKEHTFSMISKGDKKFIKFLKKSSIALPLLRLKK